MSIQKLELGAVEVELRRRVPTEDGHGFTTRVVGTRRGTVTATIDLGKLAYLAERALASKGRRATALHGAIVLRAEGVHDETAAGAAGPLAALGARSESRGRTDTVP